MTNKRFIGQVNSVEEVDRIQARVGYKVAMITVPDNEGKIQLSGPHFYTTSYNLSADSSCARPQRKNHDFMKCTCGFYSYTDIDKTVQHWHAECGGYANQAIMKVALSQKVIVCDNGYRASHQRVMHILMPHCWNCPKAGSYMVPHDSGYFVTGCEDCAKIPLGEESGRTVRDLSYSFDEFSRKFSPEGFSRMAISSASNMGRQAAAILDPSFSLRRVKEIIDSMASNDDSSAVTEVIDYARDTHANMFIRSVEKSLSENDQKEPLA